MTSCRRAGVWGGLVLALVAHSAAAQRNGPPERDGFVTTPDSVRLWYRVVGQGAETVIIPAALYHRKSFDRLARGRRVVLFDPRRRGLSDTVPASKVSIETDLADLETIRKTVGAE